MAIAVPGLVVSTNDLISVANSLDSLFNLQNTTTGQLPYAGVGFRPSFSATYHLYTLIGVADHYLYSGNLTYLQNKWPAWKRAMNYSLLTIDSTGLMNVTSSLDWLRSGMGAHNIEANAILYNTLTQGLALATALNDTAVLPTWTTTAAKLKSAANTLLWNATAGLYTDNQTTTLTPQDGNSWALVSNLTDSAHKRTSISRALAARWGPYGAPALEAANAISPFISGFELQAHLAADNTPAALTLMRRMWGYMLNNPYMTNSTFIEGYSFDGSLHYAPYTNDPRVSHAHGWATGPTSTLSFYIGGLRILSAGGRTWEVSPRLGDLRSVDVGFETKLGSFASQVNGSGDGVVSGLRFWTPVGTRGSVSLPGVRGVLRSSDGTVVRLNGGGVAEDVPGGMWVLVVEGNRTAGNGSLSTGSGGNVSGAVPAAYTGTGAVAGPAGFTALVLVAVGWFALLL